MHAFAFHPGIIGLMMTTLREQRTQRHRLAAHVDAAPPQTSDFVLQTSYRLQPQNSAFRYAQVLDWLAQFLAADAPSSQRSRQ